MDEAAREPVVAMLHHHLPPAVERHLMTCAESRSIAASLRRGSGTTTSQAAARAFHARPCAMPPALAVYTRAQLVAAQRHGFRRRD